MTARWHVGPITDAYFWWVLVTSPEILVFLFFMITDPKTIPATRAAAVALRGLGRAARLLLIAPAQDRVLGEGRGARRADDRLRRLAAAEALLAAAAAHRRARVALVAAGVLACTGRDRRRRDPRPPLRDRRTARRHGPAAGDRRSAVAGRPEQAPPEDRAQDRSRPRRRPPAAEARARAPATPRRSRARPLSIGCPSCNAQLRAARGQCRSSSPRTASTGWASTRGGQRPGRGDRRRDAGRHTCS